MHLQRVSGLTHCTLHGLVIVVCRSRSDLSSLVQALAKNGVILTPGAAWEQAWCYCCT